MTRETLLLGRYSRQWLYLLPCSCVGVTVVKCASSAVVAAVAPAFDATSGVLLLTKGINSPLVQLVSLRLRSLTWSHALGYTRIPFCPRGLLLNVNLCHVFHPLFSPTSSHVVIATMPFVVGRPSASRSRPCAVVEVLWRRIF